MTNSNPSEILTSLEARVVEAIGLDPGFILGIRAAALVIGANHGGESGHRLGGMMLNAHLNSFPGFRALSLSAQALAQEIAIEQIVRA